MTWAETMDLLKRGDRREHNARLRRRLIAARAVYCRYLNRKRIRTGYTVRFRFYDFSLSDVLLLCATKTGPRQYEWTVE